MSRRSPSVGALITALVLASTATAQTIRIGSWNIEQLGSPGSRGGDAEGIAQTPQDLADHIEDAAVDVLALQEIGDRANPGRVSPTLNETFAILNANGADWTYELTANRNQNDTTQLTGVAWNRRVVSQVGEPHRFAVMPPSNGLNHWDRHPSALRFRAQTGGTDFVVVSLHWKAGSSDTNRRQRREEVQALVERLPSFRSTFSEYDLVLIGDTNVRSTSEPTLSAITNAGFVDLNAAGQTTVPWGNVPFDHIFLATGQPEFASATMVRVVTNNGGQRRRLSNHFLVYTDIAVQGDDDAPGGDIPDPPTGGAACARCAL